MEPHGSSPPRDEGPPTPGSATKVPPVRARLWGARDRGPPGAAGGAEGGTAGARPGRHPRSPLQTTEAPGAGVPECELPSPSCLPGVTQAGRRGPGRPRGQRVTAPGGPGPAAVKEPAQGSTLPPSGFAPCLPPAPSRGLAMIWKSTPMCTHTHRYTQMHIHTDTYTTHK